MEKILKIFPEHLQNLIKTKHPLAKYTTFKIGGSADLFIEPVQVEQLQEILQILKIKDIDVKILGGGSNLLISDEGVKVAVVSIRKLKGFSISGKKVSINAGENLAGVINKTVDAGFKGLETLAGIPGTIGGALIMNAGGKYGNISDYLQKVTVIDANNKIRTLQKSEISFGVRTSSLSDFVVISADFELQKGDADKLKLRKEQIHQEKVNSQPYHKPSAGCVFKNPKKSSAGMLIDQAGMKGFQIGGAIVSNLHANYILNEENAKASEIIQVIRHVREKVHEIHGVELELEIKLWNLST